MAIIATPPYYAETLKSAESVRKLFELGTEPEFQKMIQRANERYADWHHFRYFPITNGLTHEEAWASPNLALGAPTLLIGVQRSVPGS